MAKARVYIDGQAGTTGLQIFDRIGARDDIELLRIDDALRHDVDERRRLLNACDVAFLCLPDDAAREAVALVENPDVRVIDASTAHRTADGWTYGFPELRAGQREAIAASDGSTIIPVSRVSFGFVAGGGDGRDAPQNADSPFAGGGGAGVSVQPVGFLVVGQDGVRMLPAQALTAWERAVNCAPQLVEDLRGILSQRREKTAQEGLKA